MTLGKEQRDLLRSKVQAARERLTQELTEVLEGTYGVHRDGRFEDIRHLPLLGEDERARETRELLERLLPEAPETRADKKAFAESFDATMRGIAFTHLNRLVAFKMMEHPARKLIKETVGRYTKSRGFLFFLADRPEVEQLYKTGREDDAYRGFLLHRCVELDQEIGLLFDPDDLASRVFPRPRALQDVLALINDDELEDVWRHDEALGWTYQYYTPKELRDQARKESQAPRNSYELAFRNQFYTPDYIVRFLTDNTLGRLWLEMNPGSQLREQCEYLAVGPDEEMPEREKKDPREIRVLDPACGSGHFLLYAFDLLQVIYLEAWADPSLQKRLVADFASEEAYRVAIPTLIVENNLYGIDIDRRATQIANLALFLKAKAAGATRAIEKSGIVCAEPLPGGTAQLEAFKSAELGKRAGLLGRILDALWGQMDLAGEAGTLLKIEAGLEELVDKERKRWMVQLRGKQESLLEPDAGDSEWVDYQELEGVSLYDRGVWEDIAQKIRTLFQQYAEESGGAEGTERRLFAQDGGAGLQFVDRLRQHYDVVLMNPPFGNPTPNSKKYIEQYYPSSRSDIFACFVERGIELAPTGFVGVISTEAGFFRRSLERWRKDIVLQSRLAVVAHLGDDVLDAAMVRVASYVVRSTSVDKEAPTTFLRLLDRDGREQRLVRALELMRQGKAVRFAYRVTQSTFKSFPYAVFGYWCSPGIRRAFTRIPSIEPASAIVRLGMHSGEDKRYLRLLWEIPASTLHDSWRAFAKGGEHSPFWSDIHLAIPWDRQRETLLGYVGRKGRSSIKPESIEHYGRPGITYPRRTNKRFAPRVLPAGCVFADKGPSIFVDQDDQASLYCLLGTLNSRIFGYLLSMGTGTAEADKQSNSYEVGLVKRMPLPRSALRDAKLATLSAQAMDICREPDSRNETASSFVIPFTPRMVSLEAEAGQMMSELTILHEQYDAAKRAIEKRVANHYGFGDAEILEIEEHVGDIHEQSVSPPGIARRQLAESLVSWAVGVVMGRWDIRLATGERPLPDLPEPFAPLSPHSPGMLAGGVVPKDYPFDVDSDGILVDDEGHHDDIVGRVREVLGHVWCSEAESIEAEVSAALGVKTLRDYFRRSGKGGFWPTHVSTYSKSRRRAPIYWLLQSANGSYGVWVYYHRLDRDTLYKVLHERYLLGRIERCRHVIEELRPDGEEGVRLTKEREKELAAEEAKLVELERFEKDIRELVELRNERGDIVGYDPDLNDGVVLNAAPLHKLVPWPVKRKKQNELEVYWEQLAAGEYDWAHLAMRYWPDRVLERCQDDRSIAIAHEEKHKSSLTAKSAASSDSIGGAE